MGWGESSSKSIRPQLKVGERLCHMTVGCQAWAHVTDEETEAQEALHGIQGVRSEEG